MTVASVEVRKSPVQKVASLRTRRRREAGLAYLILLPALAVFGVFTFYPFFRNFKLMLYETPPVPGLPAHFVGLHRIEMGLWDGQRMQSLVRWSSLLAADVAQLRRVLPSVQITPLEYATRAHEILEDAQRDLLSGMDVPWSGEGVLGTAAGLAATNEVVRTLTPMLGGRDNTLAEVQNELLLLGAALTKVRHEHHGTWPTLSQLSISQRELIDGTLAGALGALEQLPGALETTALPEIPTDPAGK